MQNQKMYWAIGGVIVVVAVVVIATAQRPAGQPVQTASTTEPAASSTEAQTATTTAVGPFPINPADRLVSWSFKGPYSGNQTLTDQANADIAHLTGLIGSGKYDDYDIYNGLANDYSELGDGRTAYQFYNRAIRIHPAKGLAYVNLAHLMDELHAYYTAADAYAKATAVEPGMLEYHIERLTYLTRQFPKDNARILAALTDVTKVFGDSAPILTIEAEWLTSLGRYSDAITAWQKVKQLSPGADTTSIDAEIARLQAKQ